jgi:hypothetical protein
MNKLLIILAFVISFVVVFRFLFSISRFYLDAKISDKVEMCSQYQVVYNSTHSQEYQNKLSKCSQKTFEEIILDLENNSLINYSIPVAMGAGFGYVVTNNYKKGKSKK